jgi:hypothetical protein
MIIADKTENIAKQIGSFQMPSDALEFLSTDIGQILPLDTLEK